MIDHPCIRIGHLKSFDHLILGIADLHLKNQVGTLSCSTLVPVVMNTWSQVSESLINEETDGAFITAPLAMDLFASGLDIRLLMFTHRSGSVILKSRIAGIKSINDFKGKTVLVPAELSIQNMFLHRLLSSAGLKYGTYENSAADVVREVAPPYLMAEMTADDADHDIAGFAVEEPFGREAENRGIATKICTTGSLWKNHPGSVFVLKTSFIQNYPEAVKEIVSLFTQTAQFIENNKNDALLSMAQIFSGQDKDILRHILFESDLTYDKALLIPDFEALNIIQDYMSGTMGVMKSTIDLNRLIDRSFILPTLLEKVH